MNYFYDENQVRYSLISTRGDQPINWLLFPGGPGADSSYLTSLTDLLQLSGNTWLIDLPGNGSHNIQKDGFDGWLKIFIPTVQRFQNPVLIGHSFGGSLAMMYPELEQILSGLILLSAPPCLWLHAAVKFAETHNLPDLSNKMQEFTTNPNQETFNKALGACMPYYFHNSHLEQGRKLLESVPFAFEPAVWWQHKAVEISFNASWIPKTVKTLIIGGEYDAMVPFSLFENDKRFESENIKKVLIKNAGHLPWVEQPELVAKLIKNFETTLNVKKKSLE